MDEVIVFIGVIALIIGIALILFPVPCSGLCNIPPGQTSPPPVYPFANTGIAVLAIGIVTTLTGGALEDQEEVRKLKSRIEKLEKKSQERDGSVS